MSKSTGFETKKKYYATNYFPYGIDRCGEFTREQAGLLIDHGEAYAALADETRKPVGRQEEDFVAFCRGEKEAEGKHEKAWQVFCSKIAKPKSTVKSPLIAAKPKYKPANPTDETVDADAD